LKEGIQLLKGRDRSIVKLLGLAKEEVWKRQQAAQPQDQVPALDVFLTLAVFRQESWTGQQVNEFGSDEHWFPQGSIKAFTEGPLLPLDPTREEQVLKELLKERQHFSWDAAYRGVEMHEDEEPERGPISLRIDIPEVTDKSYTTATVAQTKNGAKTLLQSKSSSDFGFDRGYHRLFYGSPRHGSNIAARSEFMGNDYHGDEDDEGNLINIYRCVCVCVWFESSVHSSNMINILHSRVAVVVWPRKDRVLHLSTMSGVKKYVDVNEVIESDRIQRSLALCMLTHERLGHDSIWAGLCRLDLGILQMLLT
jgi:hypothetical protein